MKWFRKISAGLLALLTCLGAMSAVTGFSASAATMEYVEMNDDVRAAIAAYAKTYAAKQASSSAAVLAANKNSMMPVRSSGDCATFVSSSLAYAGIPYDTQGSNKWQAGVTLSFAGTQAIGDYLKNNRSEGNGIKATQLKDNVKITSMSSSDWSKLKKGDVVCMKMTGGSGHTVVIVQEGDSMSTVKLASHTRDGVYDFSFWKSAVSYMDIYHLEGYYRTASDSSSNRVIHKTGQNAPGARIAYLKNKSTGAPLTTQGYVQAGTGNVSYSLRADKYYPGLDVFSKSDEGIAAQSKRIIERGYTHSDDTVELFNAKLGLDGDNALTCVTEAVSATQLAVWVAEGQLNLSSYAVMGDAGTRVLAAANALLSETKTAAAAQPEIKLASTGIQLKSVKQGMLTGPFNANMSYAYTVTVTGGGQGSYPCDAAGVKQTIFEAGEPFYLMVPQDAESPLMGVKISSAQHTPSYSAWQNSSTQPLVLADVSADKRKALTIGVAVDTLAKTAALTDAPPTLSLNAASLALFVGESSALSVSAEGSAKGKALVFESSDGSVAKISAKGVIQAVGAGKATITVSVEGAKESCAVTVTKGMEGIALRVGSKKAMVNNRVDAIDTNGSYPYILNKRTVVPLRFTSAQMGAKVTWTSNSKPVTVSYNGCVVTLTVGSKTLTVQKNGKTQKVTLDQAPVLKNGRVYVPLRAVAEQLGFSVKYDEASRVIIMTKRVLSSSELSTYVANAKKSLS